MKKKNDKPEKIKYNNSAKIALIICIIIIVINIIIALLGAFIPTFQLQYWENVDLYYYSIKYALGQLFQIRICNYIVTPFFLLIITIMGVAILYDAFSQSKKLTKDKKYSLVNKIRIILFILITIFGVNTIDYMLIEYNNPKIDTIYFEEQSNKVYYVEDLEKYFYYLENKVIELSHKQNRDENGKIKYNNIEDIAVTDLKKISSDYKILKGYYPTKYYKFNDYDFSIDPSMYGVTNTDSIGINYEQETPQLLNTITHELCHTRGIVRENEAVLCSVIAGIESNNELSKYAAYLEAYSRFSDAYSLIDVDKSRESEERIFELCHNNNYQEICNLYRKDTRIYVKGSKSIELQLFKRGTYDSNYLKELFNKLDKYNIKVYVDDKKRSKEEVFNTNTTDKYLKIKIKNSKEIYSEIKDYLDNNKEKFIYIKEIYDGMYEGVDMSKEKAIKYYTSPIPNSNFITSFNQKDMQEIFDYSRATRLIMEYLNHKNININ